MSDLKDRLRGFYSTGPFGKRDFAPYVPQICIEAAEEIERLEQRLDEAEELKADFKKAMKLFEDTGLDNLLWTLLDTITKGE